MILLATDLDGTFLGGETIYKKQLYDLIDNRKDILLVFVTGRGLESVVSVLEDGLVPGPDYIICDVGATILDGETLENIQPLQSSIEEKWPGKEVVQNKLENVRGLRVQNVPQTRRCSFFFDEHTDMTTLYELAADLECDVLVSAGKFVDILPKGVNKGSTLKQLMQFLDFPEESILVAGDTLNDLSMYETGYKGVVVGKAEPALLEATLNKSHVYTAVDAGAGGIIEAMEHFSEFRKFTEPVF